MMEKHTQRRDVKKGSHGPELTGNWRELHLTHQFLFCGVTALPELSNWVAYVQARGSQTLQLCGIS